MEKEDKKRSIQEIIPHKSKQQLGDEFLRDLVVLFHSDNQEAFRKLSVQYEVDCLLPDGGRENRYFDLNERDRYNLYLVKQSSDGKNILHLAALYQQRWLVKYIIDALPMIYFKLINDEDNDGLIPVDVACLKGNRDIAWDIATLENLDWRQPQDVLGRSAPPVFFSSCVAGTIGAFTNLVSSAVNTVVLDRNGRNAFWYLILYFRAEGKP
jgi:hypothetical protein